MQDSDLVFALDIGTRTVVGVVMERKSSEVRVRAARIMEHETRAMYDGQIHDVQAVADIISRIKDELEVELGIPLVKVAVAAAGRALLTSSARLEKERLDWGEISREEVHAFEMEAVQRAQQELIAAAGEEGDSDKYFCVGHSVTNYYLEGQPIGSLIGQVGTQVTIEVIATFLPRVVVDSLFSALRRAGLEIHSLTLEPIAAMTVVIPPRMRLLNLALVDIGAGTSDIALVSEGSILGYAMVPMGGDEVTEKIAEHYLLDFDTAEALKCQLAENQVVVVEDILDNQLEISVSEVANQVREILHHLATGIACEILTLNRKAPDAVLCIGGGSLIPGLMSELARALELPTNRVGIRTREAVAEIRGDFSALQGPQGVTPKGIAFNALQGEPLPFIRVVVNQREVPLWSLKETTVATALLAAGINMSNLYGKPGMGLTLEINGQVQVVKGELGNLRPYN